ncbi:Ran GTPase binding protein Sbp1 [Hypoxylon texense]
MPRKKRQTRLTFEPVAASSSPERTLSPANVRYSNAANANRSPSHNASPSKQAATRSLRRAKKTQSKLQGSIGSSRTAASSSSAAAAASIPTASFMPKVPGTQRLAADSSDDEAFDVDGPDIEWVEDPPKSSQSVSTRLRRTVINDEDEDEDDQPIVPPSSARKRGRPTVITLDSDDDDDDAPIVAPSSSKRRPRPVMVELEDSDDSDVSPAKRQKTSASTPGRLKRPVTSTSSPTQQKPHRGHRSEKQKKMELLRRRRTGEKIDKLTSSEDSDDGEKRGLYDTDPEEEFDVLKEFDDDEEADETPAQTSHKGPSKRSREKRERRNDEDYDENDNDLDDFVTDDDDAPLGAPANLDIPLEFTSQAIRPLKEQFPYAIEWLIHRRINPTFERNDPVYSNAWRKLDDEVRALASSKFASAAWKAEFYRALKGRPKLDAYEMERSTGLYDTCEACGRSNHPATFRVIFHGHPYYKNTLDDVESESENSEDDNSDGGSHKSVDTQGMPLPPATKEWHVGAVCCGNAETASSLIHWKHALRDWVDERLEDDGWMQPAKLYEREHMKARKRRELANGIADAWRENGIVTALYRDFKSTLEDARNKSTSGRNRGR